MHAAAVLSEDRFGHKGGIDPFGSGNLFDDQTIGHSHIGHGQPLGITQVDFMLAGGHLMVAVFDFDTHGLQGENGLPSQVSTQIEWTGVEVSAKVQKIGFLTILKVKIFQLRADIKSISFLPGLGQQPFKSIPRITGIRGSIRLEDVAEHTGYWLFS